MFSRGNSGLLRFARLEREQMVAMVGMVAMFFPTREFSHLENRTGKNGEVAKCEILEARGNMATISTIATIEGKPPRRISRPANRGKQMTVTNVEAVSTLMLELSRLDEARKRLQGGACKVSLHITAGYAGGAPCSITFPREDALAFVLRIIDANNIDLARYGVEIAKPAERDNPIAPAWQNRPPKVVKFPRAVEPDADGAA